VGTLTADTVPQEAAREYATHDVLRRVVEGAALYVAGVVFLAGLLVLLGVVR
jgi:hypothetical protein